MTRYRDVLVSGTLVLLIGVIGLWASDYAGEQARDVHRQDRDDLQQTLAGLTEKYVLMSFAELLEAVEWQTAQGQGAWSATPGDPQTVARLSAVATKSEAADAGLVLLGPDRAPIAATPTDLAVPAPTESGWEPLFEALQGQGEMLPLSGALHTEGEPLVAAAVPVPLADGTRGLLVALHEASTGGLQEYVANLTYGTTGHGYVVDSHARIVAGAPNGKAGVGDALPLAEVRSVLQRQDRPTHDVIETEEDAGRFVTSYADAGRTGWIAVTVQDHEEFEGALHRSSTLVQGAVVVLLLVAGGALVAVHRKREEAVRELALHDELTGAFNRRGWFALAQRELDRARRQGQDIGLLFVDLDGLKQINDALGHRAGDQAVREAAEVLRRAIRHVDLLGRIGGDEFVVLLADGADVARVRERVLAAVERHNACAGRAFLLRISVGAETWSPHESTTLDELLRRADERMYADKSARPDRGEGLVIVPVQREAGLLVER